MMIHIPHQSQRASGKGLLVAVAALSLAALVFLFWRSHDLQRGFAPLNPSEGGAANLNRSADLESVNSAEAARQGDAVQGDAVPSDPTNPDGREGEFDGLGSIRGEMLLAPGVELPASWSLRVAPSRTLRGRRRAVSRGVAGPAEGSLFMVDGLPLGGYDIWGEAPGLRTPKRAVLLTRGSSTPFVKLRFAPMGFIDGFVFRADGAAAEGVLVALAAEPQGTARREMRTNPDGSYRFDSVADGPYRMHFGPAETPLVDSTELFFRAPSLRFREIRLPPTADLLLYSQDKNGAVLTGVSISGFGNKGGRIEALTDLNGKAWARNLPPGRYRLQAKAPDNRRTRQTFVLTLEAGQECWLVLR
ncbi:MAG: carboxypeptidase-like regulatory domain-containing protein [bacterium]|jgi:hypothetical protein|nr:carboxypeptidase regulatory-like domain-containing protein [Planctomycetota bacterium]HIL51250.1 carboxypeptidase regulatory-like domain-containing protein [Planctomycetota bacterium]